jgi:hypothetical protein
MGWQGRYLFLYDLTLLEESGHQVIFHIFTSAGLSWFLESFIEGL